MSTADTKLDRRSLLVVSLLVVLGLISQGQKAQVKSDFEQLSWLVGTWRGESEKATSYESWERIGDRKMKGSGFRVVKGDTVFSEILRLELVGDKVFYIADVEHNRREVAFRLVKVNRSEAQFENLLHDFPKRIVYLRKPSGDLHVYIEGEARKENRVDFHFKRVE